MLFAPALFPKDSSIYELRGEGSQIADMISTKRYVELLKQLTDVGTVTREMFTEKFKRMKSCKETYFITVMEDLTTGKIIGSGSLVLEEKFIHSCASRGRIEDIVVDSSYRGKQLGKYIVMLLTGIAKKLKCYKITLDCRDQMVPFYESLGYKKEPGNANYMTVRISD
ncbi:unnamed protein product [Darwinula stevensoni]|uniref:Glucosamine 6-phosphate N-acetyltransferase n=1 Tax=Darwinula stevensoni TaxID=69355 RepID=A0A7R8XEV9_9CRUS|nr:unnamed protein product [Darwinula stevensoni]CAG0896110.1 unnamed protein product [Darwinula stevensoni]